MTGQMVKLPEDEDTPEKVSFVTDCFSNQSDRLHLKMKGEVVQRGDCQDQKHEKLES